MLAALRNQFAKDLRHHRRELQRKYLRHRNRWRKRNPKPSCFACGYHLKRLGRVEQCPECGVAIDWSPTIWSDGRYPLWQLLVLSATPAPVIVATVVLADYASSLSSRNGVTQLEVAAVIIGLLAMLPLSFAPPLVAVWCAASRSRSWRRAVHRQACVAVTTVVSCFVGLLVLTETLKQ